MNALVKNVQKMNISIILFVFLFFFHLPCIRAMEKKIMLSPNDDAPIICEIGLFKPHQVNFIAEYPEIFSKPSLTSHYSVQALSEADVRLLHEYLNKAKENIPSDLKQDPQQANRLKDLVAYLLIPQLMRYFRYTTCILENENLANDYSAHPFKMVTEKEIEGSALYRVVQESAILRNRNRGVFFDNLLRNSEIIPKPYTLWLPEECNCTDLVAISQFLSETDKYTQLRIDKWVKYVYPKALSSDILSDQQGNKKAIYFDLIKRSLKRETNLNYHQIGTVADILGLELVAQAMAAGFVLKLASDTISSDKTFSIPTLSKKMKNLTKRFFDHNPKINKFRRKARTLLKQSPPSDSSDSRSGSDEEIPTLVSLGSSKWEQNFTLFCIAESTMLHRRSKKTALMDPATSFYLLVSSLPPEFKDAACVKILHRKRWKTLKKPAKNLTDSNYKMKAIS